MTCEELRRILEPAGFRARELGYLSDDLFFRLDFVFCFAIDYSFLFHLFILEDNCLTMLDCGFLTCFCFVLFLFFQ